MWMFTYVILVTLKWVNFVHILAYFYLSNKRSVANNRWVWKNIQT